MTGQRLLWLIVLGTAVADFALLIAEKITLAIRWPTILGTLLLYGLSIAYRHRSAPLASVSRLATQMVAFSYVGGILTYAAMAASQFPMADAVLGRADAALGFDWHWWFAFVDSHLALKLVFAVAYYSLPVQGLVLLGYMSVVDEERAQEFLLAAMLSLILITPLMALLPAAGHHVAAVEPWRGEIQALRDHSMKRIGEVQGIVTFPSFHTVLGVLFPYMFRRRRWFLPVLVLNVLLIGSVPTEGAHYVVDAIAGVIIAFVALAVAQWLLRRCAATDLRTRGACSTGSDA